MMLEDLFRVAELEQRAALDRQREALVSSCFHCVANDYRFPQSNCYL
jgi:hypothetical protein